MVSRGNNRTDRSVVTVADFSSELLQLDASAESTNMLIYGDSDAGKTHLAATVPGNSLWLVCEPGFKVAGRLGAKGRARRIGDAGTALAAVDWLYSKDNYRRFDTVIVDGASTMQDRIRLAYTAEAFDNSPETRRSRAGRNLPDKPDYFNTQNFLKSWLAMLVDLPINLIVTAHAYRTDRAENAELLVFPGFQGKTTELANAIAGLMDVVGYLEKRRVKSRKHEGRTVLRRRLWFESPYGESDDVEVRYICGDKYGVLGSYMDAPTIPKLYAKINGEED